MIVTLKIIIYGRFLEEKERVVHLNISGYHKLRMI